MVRNVLQQYRNGRNQIEPFKIESKRAKRNRKETEITKSTELAYRKRFTGNIMSERLSG